MATHNPVIIAGHLDDSELNKAVQSLVNTIDKNTQQMATAFDSSINKMVSTLQKLTIEQQKAADSTKKASQERIASYDKEQQAMQRAVTPSTAKDSFYAFVQSYREHAAKLASELRNMPSQSLDRQFSEYQRFEVQIQDVQKRIQELRTQLQEVGRNPSAGRFEIKTITDEISRLQTKIQQLTSEQIAATKRVEQADRVAMAQKQALYNETISKIREMTGGQEKATATAFQQVEAEKQIAAAVNSSVVDKGTIVGLSREDSAEQSKKYDLLNEQNRQQEIANAKTQENLEFQRLINEAHQQRNQMTGKSKAVQETMDLRDVVAQTLGIQRSEVKIADEETASYNKLNNSLRTLREAYNRLTAEERNSDNGKTLASNIQVLERSLAQIQRQAQRPISLEAALGLNAKTLDDIAYKMQMLSRYRGGLDLTNPAQAQEVRRVNEEMKKLQKTQQDMLGKNADIISSNNLVERSFSYIKNRLAFYLTVGASSQLVRDLIEVRAQYEMVERALGVLVQSAERGTEIFHQLSEMALVSPYTLIELSTAAKQLTAYDVAAKDVVETTRRLADMTAATGVPVERLTYALGQIKAYGYLNARDARMFANAGIPLVKELAEYYTDLEGKMVTVGDVYDKIKKKAIGYEDVMHAVNKMTDEGGRFFDYQAKVADTLKVQLANLTLAWNNMLNEIGESTQGFFTGTIKGLKSLLLQWQVIERAFYSIVISFGVLKAMQFAYLTTIGKTNAGLAAQAILGEKCALSFKKMGASMKALLANPWTWVFVGIAALIDLGFYAQQVNERLEQIAANIRKNAEEATTSLEKFRTSGASKETLAAAKANQLDRESGTKAWETIRDEIELASDASDSFISKLLEIDDINERVSKGFEIAKGIEEATRALQDFVSIELPQDSWLNGFFYGGTATTIKDYVDTLSHKPSFGASWRHYIGGIGPMNSLKEDLQKDSKIAINQLADEIARQLDIVYDGVFDETKIKEGVARITKEIKIGSKELAGDAGKVFDLMLDQALAQRFPEYYDKNTNLWKQFLQELKKDATHQFQDIDEDFINGTKALTTKQKQAINHVIEELKKIRPFMSDELDAIMADLNSREFRLKVAVAFGVQESTDFQKVIKSLNAGRFYLDENYKPFLPQDKEEGEDWAKRLQEGNKKDQESLKIYEKNTDAYSKAMKERLETQIKLRSEMLEAWKQPAFPEKKGNKSSNTKKDILGDAIDKELQLINNMQKRYNEYRKMGISATEAQENATNEYGKSLSNVNNILAKYGIQTKSNKELMMSDLRELRDYFSYVLSMAQKLGNTKGIESAEKAIANINVEIAKVDMKKITDGLNNELSKVKDEYELAVELDATEGLGDALMEMLNIDASDFPRTIQEYMDRANKAFDEFRLKTHTWISPMDVFKMSEQDMRNWGTAMGFEENYVKNLVGWLNQAQGVVDKWVKDTIKQNNTMEYELGTNADKIAKKEKEIADLRAKLSNNLTDIERNNTELRIRKEEEELAKLQAELLNSIPAYAALYQSIAEHSDNMTRRLTQNMLDILEDAKNNVRDGGLFAIMYGGNEVTRMSQKELDKLIEKITKDAKKVQAPFDKIKEAFTKGDDDVIDFAKGIEYVSQEVKKLSDLVNTIGNVAEAMGLSEETTEVIRDISKSLDGLSTMQTGISQIMNKDYISGITSLAGGLLNAMSAWFDNSNNNITRQIKDSELAVKRLELAYKQLEKAVNDAIGTAVVGAEKMALANKTLQLAEVERQLTLEKTRTGKHRDEERIISLQGQYEELKNEIKDGYKEIVTNLLGISSVGSAVENMVGGVINALRNGENAIDSWNSSIDDMIVNMITKFVSAKVVAPMFQSVIDDITEKVAKRGDAANLEAQSLKQQRDSLNAQLDEYRSIQEKNNTIGRQGNAMMYGEVVAQLESQIAELDKQILDAEERAARDTEFTADDLDYMVGELVALKGQGQSTIDAVQTVLNKYGLGSSSTQSQLSALQQGIQGVTETTASAVEAYLNSVLDQMFVQVGIQSRMLLELQNSYQMQAAIHAILTGVVTANGMAFRVEMQ